MAEISSIKLPNNSSYNIRDDYSVWGGRNLLQNSSQILSNGSVLDTKTLFAVYLWSTPGQSYTGWKQIMPYTNINTEGLFTMTFQAMNDSQEYWCLKHNGSAHDYALYFKNPENIKTGDELTLSFDVIKYNPSIANGLEVKNFKLERGNKPTDWSPAPEDIARFIGNETIELYSE